jgi:hypothetical protein
MPFVRAKDCSAVASIGLQVPYYLVYKLCCNKSDLRDKLSLAAPFRLIGSNVPPGPDQSLQTTS